MGLIDKLLNAIIDWSSPIGYGAHKTGATPKAAPRPNIAVKTKKEIFDQPAKTPSARPHAVIPARNKVTSRGRKKPVIDCGAVWHGDWRYGLVEGSFGSDIKPRHFAVVAGQKIKDIIAPTIHFLPITSQKSNQAVTILPSGVLRTRPPRTSYILDRKLLISNDYLQNSFMFKQHLPEIHCNEITDYLQRGYKNRRDY